MGLFSDILEGALKTIKGAKNVGTGLLKDISNDIMNLYTDYSQKVAQIPEDVNYVELAKEIAVDLINRKLPRSDTANTIIDIGAGIYNNYNDAGKQEKYVEKSDLREEGDANLSELTNYIINGEVGGVGGRNVVNLDDVGVTEHGNCLALRVEAAAELLVPGIFIF